jgi:general secretion pathway protein A
MYRAFFGLGERPFAITPDPRYLYLSARHSEALAHLVYGINDAGGFIQLTGEVGTGKTTTIRSLLARAPKNAEIALIINPRMSSTEFLQTICEELGLGVADTAEGNTKELVDQLNRYLLRAHAEGHRVVLIVDEAQNLAPDVLEQVRLLTNLETESQKLLQIILIGQPELRDLLARNDLRQLAQRVTARYHLAPLGEDETAAYVRHRLRVAGATSEIFTPAALREIYRVSGGVPRVINVIADRALLGAYTSDQHDVGPALVRQAGSEVFNQRLASRWVTPAVTGAVLALLLLGAYAFWQRGPWRRSDTAPAAAATNPPPEAIATPAPVRTSIVTPVATLLQETDAARSAQAALLQLLKLWQSNPLRLSEDACTQASAAGLECVSLRSTLAQLRELNRPAVLALSDNSRRSFQVLVTQLDNESAWLRSADRDVQVSIADLSRYWFGDLVLLWRPPVPTVNRITNGMRGPAVKELRERLLRWSGAPPPPVIANSFDSALAGMLEQFQIAHHLAADGTAGLDTQLILDSVLAAPGTPVLNSSPIEAAKSQG